jgi:hypothetical protein
LFKNENATNIFITRLLLFAGGMFVIILILSLLLLLIIKKGGIKTRYKDIFSILTYSLLPYFFAAFILFPIEIIIFGEYLFSVNPSPYIIKSFLAWAITGFEILLIIWSLFLLTMGIFAQTKSNKFSIIASASINLIIYLSIYCYSVYLAL